MAGVSARRAPPESRAATKLLHALPKTRNPPPMRLKRSVPSKSEEVEAPGMDNAQGTDDADLGDQHDDRSSSLSEPDEDIEELEDHIVLEDGPAMIKSQPPTRSLEVDSDAETERLEQTPQKQSKHPDSLGRTPSKLSQTATAEDELSEPPSPLAAGAGATSSTSTGATAGQKRKRSDTADSSLSSADSDLGESPRKRSHEMTADDQIHREEAAEEIDMAEEMPDRAGETPMLEEEEVRDTPPAPAKGLKGKKGKPKGKKQKEQTEETEAEATEDVAEPIEDPSEEDPIKTEEQRQAKKEASGVYNDVSKIFRSFRDRLYSEQLATLASELELLEQPECVHPEYLRQVACVDARLQKQTKEARAFFMYKYQSIRERTLGERSQLHSQYFQNVRQIREDVLYQLGEQWYAIQKERRQSHQPDAEDAYLYMYDPKHSAQLKRQEKYNLEVSILSGMAQHVGFPSAPEIRGAEVDDVNQDLKKMKVAKTTNRPVVQSRPLYNLAGPNTAAQFIHNERIAHEQYLEQNAWARPQMPIHAHATPGISHTPDWADSSAGKHVRQNPHLGARNSSPFATPLPQKHMQHIEHPPSSGAATVGLNSDGIGSSEALMPSSAVAAPPTVDRMALFQQLGGSSNHTSPLTFPKGRENGANGDPPGFRNISGISGASTIDAPPEVVAGMETTPMKAFAPGLSAEHSSTPQTFPTSQLHLQLGDESKDVYASAGFRPQAGAFGTPAPLQAPPTTGNGS